MALKLCLALWLVVCSASLAFSAAGPKPGYSFTCWDWTPQWRDFSLFKQRLNQLKQAGFTCCELSLPWRDLEPSPGRWDFSAADARIAYARSLGLDVRLRLNTYYSGYPGWFKPEFCLDYAGRPWHHLPSLFAPYNLGREYEFFHKVAEHYRGQGFTYSPGLCTHMELKFSEFVTYEPAAREAFRSWLKRRYGSLNALNTAWQAAYARWYQVQPPLPRPTHGEPDLARRNRDWLAFRQYWLRQLAERFAKTIRTADPSARVSFPLGESWRSQSAEMANLDYAGLGRYCDEIVHSYDFFWHPPSETWGAAASVKVMGDLAGKPVWFEIDGPSVIERYHYTPAQVEALARAAIGAGASGINVSNWQKSPLEVPFMVTLGRELRAGKLRPFSTRPGKPALVYLSPWTNYAYREPTEWVHDYQFGLLKAFFDLHVPFRVASDDNLSALEPREYSSLWIPFAPVVEETAWRQLQRLVQALPTFQSFPAGIADMPPGQAADRLKACGATFPRPAPAGWSRHAPGYRLTFAPAKAETPLKKGRLTTFDCPIGWLYLQPNHHREALELLLQSLNTCPPK